MIKGWAGEALSLSLFLSHSFSLTLCLTLGGAGGEL